MSNFAYTYVLRCGDSGLYVGSTSDLKRRIKEHLCGSCRRRNSAYRSNSFTTKRVDRNFKRASGSFSSRLGSDGDICDGVSQRNRGHTAPVTLRVAMRAGVRTLYRA